ncbi:MAG: cytochrome-c oxidase, cbb3-type subunit III [Propylenella sp.]
MADDKGPASAGPRIDKATGTETTGHQWDGIEELNTPLPRWWLWTFYATIVWALGYVVVYPAIPLINSATQGAFGWDSRQAVADELARAEAGRQAVLDRIRDLPLEDIRADEELSQVAFRGGQSAFKVNCVQCHGSGAEGGVGYANLNDDSWIWGGTLDAIHTTILHGVRYTQDPDTRVSEMLAFGRDGMLESEQIAAVTQYVLSLSGGEQDADAAAAGATIFAENCAACHGEDGVGNQELGAPALNDAVWLYGGTPEDIQAQVFNPRHGVMPAWAGRLDPVVIKQLAIYVHGLGGGETPEAGAAN